MDFIKHTKHLPDQVDDFFKSQKCIWFEGDDIHHNFDLNGCYLWSWEQVGIDPVLSRYLKPIDNLKHQNQASGVALVFAEKFVSKAPIYILCDQTYAQEGNFFIFGAEHVNAHVHQMFMHANGCENIRTYVVGQSHARIEHVMISMLEPDASLQHRVYYHAHKDSQLTANNLCLSGAAIDHHIDLYLSGEGASGVLDGLFLGTDKSAVKNTTHVHHLSSHTVSSESYKGILAGKSKGTFQGRIVVAQDLKDIQASQINQNMLLSDDAKIDTSPELDILSDDVKCSHGATVGRVDPQQLYYLQSRGLSTDQAYELLLKAFASDVIPERYESGFKNWLDQAMDQRFQCLTQA